MTSADPVALARAVLEADGHPFKTLSLAPSLLAVTADTPVPDARRNYMRVAALIHPDKIKNSFERATEAFQCLVRAFETFADPRKRKAAVAAIAKEEKAAGKRDAGKTASRSRKAGGASQKTASSQESTRSRKPAASKVKKTQKPRTKVTKKGPREDEDDEEDFIESDSHTETDSESDAGSEDSFDGFLSEDVEPAVSTSRTAIGVARTGGVNVETTIGCPHCHTLWQPDTKPQYSLFMGPWGKRVHCQLCLFVFGSATAVHACPHCTAPFDYDSTMYETTIDCKKCKKTIGFPYFPVCQQLVDQIAVEEWREKRDRAKAKEREARAQARHSGAAGSTAAAAEEKLTLLIGTCVVEDRCPLCEKTVKSHHRAHVMACMENGNGEAGGRAKATKEKAPPSPAKRQARAPVPPPKKAAKTLSGSTASTAAAVSKKAAPKKAAPKKAAAKKTAAKSTASRAAKGRRRRGGSSSDEDEDESEASFSDESEVDSASDSDDDEDYDDSDDE